jgi:trk system potassium uptake protein TrkA
MEKCSVIDIPLKIAQKYFSNFKIKLLGIVQKNDFIIPSENIIMRAGDEVYFVAEKKDVRKVMSVFGHEEREARRVVILGGGNIGSYIAKKFEEDEDHEIKVKLIEYDRERAELIATELHKTTILNGSALDNNILQEAGVADAEAVIAVTNDDETNVLGSLLAKRQGCGRSMSLVNNASYSQLLSTLGVDVVINPRDITISSILQHIRRGKILSVNSIADGKAEIIEAEAIAGSSVVGKTVENMKLPKGIIVAALIRGEQSIIACEETIVNSGDKVIIVASSNMVSKVEKLFTVPLDCF